MTSKELEELIKRNGGQAPQSPQAAADGLVNTGNSMFTGVSAPAQPTMTPELAAQREAARGGAGDPNLKPTGFFGQLAQVPAQIGRNVDNFLGTAQRALTPKDELGYTPPTMGDVAASAGIRDAQGNVFGSGSAPTPQAPTQALEGAMQGASQLNVGGATTPAGIGTNVNVPNNPFSGINPLQNGIQMAQQAPQAPIDRGAAIAAGEQRMQGYRDGSGLSPTAQQAIQPPSIQMGDGTQLPSTVQASQAPSNAPMGAGATQDALQARFGAPTISAIQSAPEGLGMATDAQGRMVDPTINRSAYEQASQARSDSAGRSPRGGVSDRDRRMANGEPTSMADLTDMAAANQPGASPRDVARGQQVANALGVDLKTGEPKAQEEPMTEKEQLQVEEQKKRNEILDQQIAAGNNPAATASDKKLGEQAALWKSGQADGTLEQWEVDAQRKDFYKKPAPSGYRSWVEYEAEQRGAEGDPVATTVDGSAAPSGKLPTVVSEADYNNLKPGDKYIYNGKELTKK